VRNANSKLEFLRFSKKKVRNAPLVYCLKCVTCM